MDSEKDIKTLISRRTLLLRKGCEKSSRGGPWTRGFVLPQVDDGSRMERLRKSTNRSFKKSHAT